MKSERSVFLCRFKYFFCFALLNVSILITFSNAFGQLKPFKVYVWLSAECPLSQKYTLTLNKLHKQYQKSPISFTAIFPSDNTRNIKKFKSNYVLEFETLKDEKREITNKYHATTTPEVVLLDAMDQIIYRGALDDQAIALGKFRASPQHEYLKNALDSALKEIPLHIKQTNPIGCIIY